MKKKYIALCLLPVFLVGCQSKQPDDMQHLFDAAQLKNNETFTGYRLNMSQVASSSNEVVYSETKFIRIDRTNNYYEVQQFITKIASSADSFLTTEEIENHIYYDQGSQYVLQEDNSYKQYDGTVTRSSLLFKFNPKKSYFDNIEFVKEVNVYNFAADIIPSKANDLFGATGLESITNASMEIEVFDDELQRISYKFTMDQINVTAQITMFYDPYIITLPITR